MLPVKLSFKFTCPQNNHIVANHVWKNFNFYLTLFYPWAQNHPICKVFRTVCKIKEVDPGNPYPNTDKTNTLAHLMQ